MMQQVDHKNSQRRAHQPVFCEETGGPCCPGWQNSAAPQTANAANPFVLSSEINSSAVNATHKYRHYVENFLLNQKKNFQQSPSAHFLSVLEIRIRQRIRIPRIRMFLGSLASESSSISQRYGSGSGSGSFPFLTKVLRELK